MSAPGFLAVSGSELANNARTIAYLQAGLGGGEFQVEQAGVCTDLLEEAWPDGICTTGEVPDQLYTSPLAAWRVPNSGAVPTLITWDASGVIGQPASASGAQVGAVLPNLGVVEQRLLVEVDFLKTPGAGRGWFFGKVVNPGTANVGWMTLGLVWNGSWTINLQRRIPNGGAGSVASLQLSTLLFNSFPETLWLEVLMTSVGITMNVYGGDPVLGNPVALTATYGYDSDPTSSWALAAGQSEAASMAAATEVGALMTNASPAAFTKAEAVVTSISRTAGAPCEQGDLYPADTLYPGDDLYPGQYGVFVDPATDGAPWADAERPESYGFLGLIISDITGLDTTSTRTMSDAADGIGGILGPTQLEPRDLEVRGWFIADGDQAMEYGRRWFAQVLGGSLCEGCGSDYVDLRSTCSGDADAGFYTNRWRLYDVGVTSFEADTSDPLTCGRITPVVFKLAAANPYLYGPELEQVPATLLNPDGPDAPPVPFESWLFNDETAICTTLEDEQVGEQAPIFSFYGGTAGIESGLVYVVDELYPADGLYPADDLYPGEDTVSGGGVPFVFSFAVGPGERFVIDAAQRRVVRTLADGVTQVDGSASLYMGPGDVITWPDTCAGDLAVCARAYAACTCDETATVTITSMHRER